MKKKRAGLSKQTRFLVMRRDRFTCQYCGGRSPTVKLVIDHIVPVARNGLNSIDNLRTSCSACNAGKATHLERDYDFHHVSMQVAERWKCKPGYVGAFVFDVINFIDEYEVINEDQVLEITDCMLHALALEAPWTEPIFPTADTSDANGLGRMKQFCQITKAMLKIIVYEEKKFPDALHWMRGWLEDNKTNHDEVIGGLA